MRSSPKEKRALSRFPGTRREATDTRCCGRKDTCSMRFCCPQHQRFWAFCRRGCQPIDPSSVWTRGFSSPTPDGCTMKVFGLFETPANAKQTGVGHSISGFCARPPRARWQRARGAGRQNHATEAGKGHAGAPCLRSVRVKAVHLQAKAASGELESDDGFYL